MIVLVLAFVIVTWSPQLAQEWNNIPQSWGEWFKTQRSRTGVPCCDVADGHPTLYEIRGNSFWVPIAGGWYQVPEDSIIYNAKNPTGQAVVWYVKQGNGTYYIRCFVRDAET